MHLRLLGLKHLFQSAHDTVFNILFSIDFICVCWLTKKEDSSSMNMNSVFSRVIIQFLSNIVTVQAICTDKEGKNWRFVNRPNCLESHECFVRIAEPSNITGILIELSFVYSKEVCNSQLLPYP